MQNNFSNTDISKTRRMAFFLKIGVILSGLLSILFTVIAFSSDIIVGNVEYKSVWELADIVSKNNGIHIGALIGIILFAINAVFIICGSALSLKKKNKGLYILSVSNLLLSIAMLVIQGKYKFTGGSGILLYILNLLLAVIGLAGTVFRQIKQKNMPDYEKEVIKNETKTIELTKKKKHLFIMDVVALVSLLSLFVVPLYSYKVGNVSYSFWLLQALGQSSDIGVQIAFLGVLLTFLALIIYFVHMISFYFNYEKIFVSKSQGLVYGSFGISLIYFLVGYIISLIKNINGQVSSTVSFIPLIIMTVVMLAYSIMKGKYNIIGEKEIVEVKKASPEPLLYLVILTALCFMLLFVKVIEVHYEFGKNSQTDAFTGLQLLQNHALIGGGYQVLAFAIFTVMLTSFVLLVLSACAFLSRYKDYHKMTKMSIYIDVVFLFILGIAGFYFGIAQKINQENLALLLESFKINIDIEMVSEIKSQTIYLFIIGAVVLIVAMFRGQLNIAPVAEVEQVPALPVTEQPKEPVKEEVEQEEIEQPKPKNVDDFDACPAFTELDSKKELFDKLLEKRKQYNFEDPTLPELVTFIVDYARESRLHLSYTREDIATFVAGLGASRLTILQGMSGTGKTSLPKIFSEAILGNCEIVEVESSWRDKNELLGYYNEFSKTYSPKKFTERLYKAKLNPEIVTFIVLDEMNLSRIEYYFSDFLSLMEHEEHKREIKLLNVKLQRTENNEKHDYLALQEGHTIKIPTNVWFIGTANRDESTFEISDKVYDRAQTMNFDKRAPKVRSYSKPIPQKYMSYKSLSNLLKSAINNGNFEAEDNEIIKEVEKILQPFNISFGNRVLKQMEEFVKIYCACFNNSEEVVDEAVEKILLSKVVHKLEFKNVDNKDKLVKQFNKLGLTECSKFVSKLNED